MKALKFLFWVIVSISILSYFGQDATENDTAEAKKEVVIVEEDSQSSEPEEANIDYSKEQYPDEIMPCDAQISYVTYLKKWQTLQRRTFGAKFTMLQKNACASQEFRENLKNPISDGTTRDFYGKVYLELSKDSRGKINKLVKIFSKIREKYDLSYQDFAEVVVTYVQNIPYVLVHPESCRKARSFGGFMETYHQEGKECLPDIRFGLASPAEFAYNLKGDCDTRAVFLYNILSNLGYDVAVFVSDEHSMLGINIPAQGDYLSYKGKKYYFWETTAVGFTTGVVPPEFKKQNWKIALVKPSKS